MAYVAITSGEIATGEPVAATTQTKIKDNFADHESRITTLEAAGSAFPPIIFRVNGLYAVAEGLIKTTANFSFSITGVRILVDQAGSSGSIEIDILKKRGGDPFESILTALPTANYTDGDDFLSDGATLNPTKIDVEAGDILRLDITSIQAAGVGFLVRIDYNRGED